MSSSYLIGAVFFPVLSALVMPLLKIKEKRAVRIYTGTVTVLTTLFVWLLILKCKTAPVTLIRFTRDFSLTLKFDPAGRFFAGISATLWPLTVLYGFEYMEEDNRQDKFFFWFTMTFGITLGIAMSGNLFSMYVFYELLTLTTLPLVYHTHTPEAYRAARLYIGLSVGGAAFSLMSIIYLVLGGVSSEPAAITQFMYLMGVLGFGVKSALFPLHIWLPKASVAPTPVTALLHAVAVVKAGVFAVIRLTYYGYTVSVVKGGYAQTILICLSAFTIVFGAARAVREINWKKRLAYSTVDNLSYILFGALLMTEEGMAAAFIHMAFHAQIKILSFFAAGTVLHHTGRASVYELDGLGKKMPVTMLCFTLSALGLIGIPPFSGFISKWYLLLSAAHEATPFAYVGAGAILISALLTAVFMLTSVRRMYFPDKEADLQSLKDVKEAGLKMTVPMMILGISILLLGIFPGPVIRAAQEISEAATAIVAGGGF